MNRINSISIEGYKSIRQCRLDINPLNVLIGANGAGKSNLISFFKLLNFLHSGALQVFIGQQGGANSLLHYGPKQTTQIAATVEFETDSGINRYHLRLAYAAMDTLIFTEETISYSKHGLSTEGPVTSLGAGHRESLLKTHAENKKPSWQTAKLIANAIGLWRVFQFHDTSDTARVKQSHYVDDAYYLRADAGNLAPFLYRMSQDDPAYYRRIVDTIRLCAPFFDDFVLIPPAPESKSIILNWRERGSDVLFGPHQLSDGTLRLMALLTLLLQPRLPAMVIIDEPELGLHPYAINVLADLLRAASQRTQVMIATQSVNLVDQFDPDNILVVDRINMDRMRWESKFHRRDAESLKEWLQDYSLGELWEKNVLGGRPN